jgi:hypothetical protein
VNQHVASCSTLLRWRGWRPPFLDHESWERADDVTFVLEREGDLALLPCGAGHGANDAPDAQAHNAFITLQEMIAEGWHVVGRLHVTFVGQDAEDHFWEATLRALGMDEATHPYAADVFWSRVL